MKSSSDTVRQIVVIASTVFAIVGAFIGSGAAGGTPIQRASDGTLSATYTLIAPDVPAFSIWSVIYLGLVAYAVWQARPSVADSARQRRLGYWIAASLVLNACWIISVQFGLLSASLPTIVALLVVLVRAFQICLDSRPASRIEALIVDGTLGLYLGWVCVATAANAASLLKHGGFTGFGIAPTVWGIAIVAVAGLIGVLLGIRDRGRIAPMLAVAWGIAWIAVGRLTGELRSTPVAIAAIVCVVAVVLVTVVLRLRGGRNAAGRDGGIREATRG